MGLVSEEGIKAHREMVRQSQERADKIAEEVSKKYRPVKEQDIEGELHKFLCGR